MMHNIYPTLNLFIEFITQNPKSFVHKKKPPNNL